VGLRSCSSAAAEALAFALLEVPIKGLGGLDSRVADAVGVAFADRHERPLANPSISLDFSHVAALQGLNDVGKHLTHCRHSKHNSA
jgi:hypothetical protein